MLDHVARNRQKNKYVSESEKFHIRELEHITGWRDYLIGERVIFSHRITDYGKRTLYDERFHAHEFYEVLIYMTEDMQYISDGGGYLSRRGTVICTPPHIFHLSYSDPPKTSNRYVLYFSDALLSAFGEDGASVFDFINAEGAPNCMRFDGDNRKELLQLLDLIEKELQSPCKCSVVLIYSYLCRLFVLFSDASHGTGQKEERPNEALPSFLHDIKEYIDQNCTQISGMDELAKKYYYSREYISRAFKKYFNISVTDYIRSRKLLKSRENIDNGMSVEEAARAAGFWNMSSFIRQFRKQTGMLPSEYRNRHIRREGK